MGGKISAVVLKYLLGCRTSLEAAALPTHRVLSSSTLQGSWAMKMNRRDLYDP